MKNKTTPFDDFIAPAREKAQYWRIAVTLILFATLYSILIFLYFLSVEVAFPAESIAPSLNDLLFLGGFIFWIFALLCAIWLVHRRGLRSLLGHSLSKLVGHFCLAVIGFGLIGALFTALLLGQESEHVQLGLSVETWLGYLAIGVLVLLIQVSAEELLFRGYLQQQLAVKFNTRWVYLVLPSVVFGLFHIDVDYGTSINVLLVLNTGLLGFFAADVTYRTGHLGAAIGVHFANNFLGIFVLSAQSFLDNLALYRATDIMAQADKATVLLIQQAVIFTVFITLYLIYMEHSAKTIQRKSN